MCGRFSLTLSAEDIGGAFGVEPPGLLAPRYNIAPSQPVLAIREKNVAGDPEAVLLNWGLVPSWAKDPAMGSRMINARAETLAEKPSFRGAYRHRRCLIPADGFYEWKGQRNDKVPLHIRRADRGLFAFAGLWEQWVGADGSEIFSCAIITMEANEMMRPIHQRMPVILAEEAYALWLSREVSRPDELAGCLAGKSWEGMHAQVVSTYVNSPRNEGPKCVEAEPDLFSTT